MTLDKQFSMKTLTKAIGLTVALAPVALSVTEAQAAERLMLKTPTAFPTQLPAVVRRFLNWPIF